MSRHTTSRWWRVGNWTRLMAATALVSVLIPDGAHAGNPRFAGGKQFQGTGQRMAQPATIGSAIQPKAMQFSMQPKTIQSSNFRLIGLPQAQSNLIKPQVTQSRPILTGNRIKQGTLLPGTNSGGNKPSSINTNSIRPNLPTLTGNVVNTKPTFPKPNGDVPGTGRLTISKPGSNMIITKPIFPKPNGGSAFKPLTPRPGTLNPIGSQIGKVAPKGDGIKVTFPAKPLIDPARIKPGIKLDSGKIADVKPRPRLTDMLGNGKLAGVLGSQNGKKLDLNKQFDLKQKGDVALKLGLFNNLAKQGGWNKRLFCGPVTPQFKHSHFGCWYPGPACYPSWCWAPCWSPWVDWCWWDYCYDWCDPRPIWCRPICYDPCAPWVVWEYPVWQPLPVVLCGTWVDVPVLHVEAGLDVQLLAVRFVDPGHPEQQLGPRYRVWFRNNSPVDIAQPFDVLLMASNNEVPAATLPQAGVRVTSIPAGAIQVVDIRLPFEANVMNRDAAGRQIPFSNLHVLVDARREIAEVFEENNGQVIARQDIFPVDPATFAADTEAAPAGSAITIAGEGFGPEPGRVLVFVAGLELEAAIEGWYDLGVRAVLPGLQLAAPTAAEIVVIRGDGAAADPLTFTLLPGAGNAVVVSPPGP